MTFLDDLRAFDKMWADWHARPDGPIYGPALWDEVSRWDVRRRTWNRPIPGPLRIRYPWSA